MGTLFAERDAALVPGGKAEVGMDVDHRKPGSRHARFGYVQHALGLEILEREAGGFSSGWFSGGGGRRAKEGNLATQQRGSRLSEQRSAVHRTPPAGMPGIRTAETAIRSTCGKERQVRSEERRVGEE